MLDVVIDSCLDIVKTMPILLVVYMVMYFLETRMQTMPAMLEKVQRLGPAVGAVVGTVPQCGFAAAASTLYNNGYLAPATLIAVFLSTSDEALPVLLSQPNAAPDVLLLILCKLVLAISGGFILQHTVFRGERGAIVPTAHEMPAPDAHGVCCRESMLSAVLWRTVKTTLFLMLTMLTINLLLAGLGEQALSVLLLDGSLLQPALCALIGLIPGCAISVLLSGLYLQGAISFGAVLAGLSTGAGFGYVLLLQKKSGRRHAAKIILCTYAVATLGGMLVQIFLA